MVVKSEGDERLSQGSAWQQNPPWSALNEMRWCCGAAEERREKENILKDERGAV